LEIENLKLSELKIKDLEEIIGSKDPSIDKFEYSEEQEDGFIFKIELLENILKIDFYNQKIGKMDYIELKKELFYNENNLYALSHFMNNFFES